MKACGREREACGSKRRERERNVCGRERGKRVAVRGKRERNACGREREACSAMGGKCAVQWEDQKRRTNDRTREARV
jgi:hypothetical protein